MSTTVVDEATLAKLDAAFEKLEAAPDCKSLLKKYLTQPVYQVLRTRRTESGATLLDVIQSGVENLDSGIGVYAPDAASYAVFSPLFDAIIAAYHGFPATAVQPQTNFGDPSLLVNLDPENKYIISTRVRCGRSLKGYPFNPLLSQTQYQEIESAAQKTLAGLSGEFGGTYFPLTGMNKTTQQTLIDDHFLFKEGDRFLQAANACRYWPTGRGIFHNDAKTFLVWINEEDHLRIISMEKGSDLRSVYTRLVAGVQAIEQKLEFSRDDRLGYLTFCPTNLGTTIRASVHVVFPRLGKEKGALEEVAGRFNLQVRGTRGEHSEGEGGVFDVSNKRRMGLTEFEALKELQDGILEMIRLEEGGS
jgi:arginine kinase